MGDTVPAVTLAKHGDLYCIPAGDNRFSCLGFDVCEERIEAVAAWLAASGDDSTVLPKPKGERGDLDRYAYYRQLMDEGQRLHQRTGKRCDHNLDPRLTPHLRARVKVTSSDGSSRSFWVGRSTGWMPTYLEIARIDSSGGDLAYLADDDKVQFVRRR